MESLHSQLLVKWGVIFLYVRYHYYLLDQSLKIQEVKEGCITGRNFTLVLAFPLPSSSHPISIFTQSVLMAHKHTQTQTQTRTHLLSQVVNEDRVGEHSAGHCRWNTWNTVWRLEITGLSTKPIVPQCWLPILAGVVWIVVGRNANKYTVYVLQSVR